jgi:hypothetical protein
VIPVRVGVAGATANWVTALVKSERTREMTTRQVTPRFRQILACASPPVKVTVVGFLGWNLALTCGAALLRRRSTLTASATVERLDTAARGALSERMD